MIAFRDRPAPFGPSCIRPWTLVAITNSSRRPKSFRARPTISSLVPVGVHVRGVEEVDSRLECLTDQRSAALLVQGPRVGAALRVAEAHAAQARAEKPPARSLPNVRIPSLLISRWPRRSSAAITCWWMVFLASARQLAGAVGSRIQAAMAIPECRAVRLGRGE